MEGGVEEADLYESLPEKATVGTYMLAGAMAGMGEHCVMYPFDCVKTRMQSLVPDPKANYKNVPDALVKIFRHEGLKNTVRGVNALIVGAGPAHALYFACYEKLKRALSGGSHANHLANGAAGCVATVIHDSVMNPADVVKQRMQMYGSPYKSCTDCCNCVMKKEGVRAFYRSFTTQLTMNIPFQAVHFMTYEITQNKLNPDRKYDPLSHGVSGAVAGAGAAFVTMPLDVCKTLLNTQEHCARTSMSYVNGLKEAFKLVYEFQGIKGYFRGVQARILYQMPSTAISWSVYELFKYLLSQRNHQDDGKYLSMGGMSVQAASSPKS